jgi:hypothetical protein
MRFFSVVSCPGSLWCPKWWRRFGVLFDFLGYLPQRIIGEVCWSEALQESWVLRRIFGPRRDEVTGEWRKLHNEELHDLYFSTSIIRVIKSRRMRWARHVARMGPKRTRVDCWWGS